MDNPYYKVQYFCKISLSWKDIQVAHPSILEARASIVDNTREYRLMEVKGKKRTPIEL